MQKFVIVLTLGCSTLLNAVPFSRSLRIDSIEPGFVTAGIPSILLITGKNLGRFRGALNCDIAPTAGPVSSVQCFVNYVEGSNQLEVHLQAIGATTSSDYILRFCDVSKDKRNYLQGCGDYEPIKVVTMIHVVKPTNSTTPTTSPETAPIDANPSPFTDCLNANSTPSPVLESRGSASSVSVNCAASLLTESEVIDNFGRHVDKTYFAIQVRVSNQNSNYDFLLRDILLTLPDGRVISSRIRRFAQGVAVKGKSLDRRAVFYDSMQAIGSLYGGLAIFASTGFQAAGNALQGPLMQGFSQIFPDTTTDNVNRFNTAVFDDQNPSIVPKDSIGQPPLYVVALVPKTGNAEADKRFGERIAVSLEGTYIKQVSLVSISPSSLKFAPEFISPPSNANDPAVTALRSASQSRRVQISNNNSTVMNISGISLLSADGKESRDFEIDPKKTTCGTGGGNQVAWDSKAKFSIPAQSFCEIWVRTTPQTPGAVSATLEVEGDNLDGSKTVYLEGQGVGFIYDLTNGTIHNVPPFACSYSDSSCPPIPLGTIATTSWSFPVYYYLPAGASSLGLSWQQNGKAAVTSCNGVTSAPDRSAGRCQITLDLSDASGNAGLTLTGNGWTSTVNFTYQTTPTTLVMTTPSPGSSILVGAQVPITIAVQDAGHNTLTALPDGTQIQISISGCQNSATNPIKVGTKAGLATVPGSSITVTAPGLCKVDATMPATGIYAGTKLPTANLTAALPASVIATMGATTSIDHTKPFSIPLTVTATPPTPGVICTGAITYAAPPGLVFDPGGPLTLSSGTATLTVTSGMASGQSYTITFKYGGDDKACGGSPDMTFQFSTQ